MAPIIFNKISEQTTNLLLYQYSNAGLDPAVCNQLIASAASHVKCIYSWIETATTSTQGELAQVLVTYMNNVSTTVCRGTSNDETIGYLFLFWYNLLENTDLIGTQGLVAVTMFNDATILAIIDYIYHFIHQKRGASTKLWGYLVRLVSLLLGSSDEFTLAKEAPLIGSKWLEFLHTSGKGYILLDSILLMVAGN